MNDASEFVHDEEDFLDAVVDQSDDPDADITSLRGKVSHWYDQIDGRIDREHPNASE
jgi:hypothetical protein